MDVIYLRGINWNSLLASFTAGEFSNETLSNTKVARLKQSVTVIDRGTSAESSSYTYKDRGVNVLVFTTNNEQFNAKKVEGEGEGEGGLAVIEGQCCQWCRCTIKTKPIGIPVGYLKDSRNNQHIMQVSGVYCCFECCFSGLKSKGPVDKYRFSEAYLRVIFAVMHPGKVLKDAPDWTLHKVNGGILDDAEFHNTHHHYSELSGFYILPCKQLYRQVSS